LAAIGGGKHINCIENFWNRAKRHLRKYTSIPRQNFHLFVAGAVGSAELSSLN
jgi:transposase-like protein